jgi:hypothetical protein
MVPIAPHRDMGRLQGVTHHAGQVVPVRIQVDRQTGRKHHHRVFGVITGPVEAAVHQLLVLQDPDTDADGQRGDPDPGQGA